MYYVLYAKPDEIVVGQVSEEDSPLYNKYLQGSLLPIEEYPKQLVVEIETSLRVVPDYLELQGIPIASANFIQGLKNSGVDNFQAFSANLKLPEKVITGYSILNYIGLVECIDRDNSDLTLWRKKISRINRLQLKKNNYDLDLFRLAEFKPVVLVSKRVKDMLSPLSGVILDPAADWSDRVWY